jgi:hypothetical protein
MYLIHLWHLAESRLSSLREKRPALSLRCVVTHQRRADVLLRSEKAKVGKGDCIRIDSRGMHLRYELRCVLAGRRRFEKSVASVAAEDSPR